MSSVKAKIIAICVTMAVTVVSFVCSTLAFFTDSITAQSGGISAGKATAQIIDITYPYGSEVSVPSHEPIKIMPGYDIQKRVIVRNTGSLPLYVRIKIDTEIKLADSAFGREAEIDLSLVGYNIDTAHWQYHEGYYYYNAALMNGEEIVPLFTEVSFSEQMGNLYKDSTIVFDVQAEVVQANNNGPSAIEAYSWGNLLSGGNS